MYKLNLFEVENYLISNPNAEEIKTILFVLNNVKKKEYLDMIFNSGYNKEQIYQIVLGYKAGLDPLKINYYAKPESHYLEMSDKRELLLLNVKTKDINKLYSGTAIDEGDINGISLYCARFAGWIENKIKAQKSYFYKFGLKDFYKKVN